MAEVGIAELRRSLKDWVDRVQSGEEVVITERGKPVARLTSIDGESLLDRLVAEGRVSPPSRAKRPHAEHGPRVRAKGDVSTFVIEERNARR